MTDVVTSGETEVFTLAASELGMVVNTAGSASCQYFVFFRAESGREAQAVAAPFVREKRVLDLCYNEAGFLARVDGTDAFVAYQRPIMDKAYAFRVFPWQAGTWGKTCRVVADFDTRYEVSDVFRPDDGPLRDDVIRNIAPEIARRRDAKEEPWSLGAGATEKDREEIYRIRARKADDALPTFGKESRQLDTSYRNVPDNAGDPVVIGGQTFLVFTAHPRIGWRTYPDWLMVFYSLGGDAGTPVGSAIVKAHRGALKHLAVETP